MAVAQHWWHGAGGALPSGPFAVYSVRKAVPGYAGNAFRVIRASDSAEQDIGFSGDDYDTAAVASFCSGTTGHVKSLYDQSGNGRDIATGAGTSGVIVYSAGAIFTRSGKNAWNWNGSGTQFNLPAATIFTTVSVGAVAYNSSTGGSQRTIVGGVNAGAPQLGIYNPTPATLFLNRQNQANLITAGITPSAGLHTFYFAGGTSAANQTIGCDGSDVTGGGGGSYAQGVRSIGMKTDTSAEKWDDGISELVYYERILTSTERADLQANQKTYFGTP
jgi:hypothetical protein